MTVGIVFFREMEGAFFDAGISLFFGLVSLDAFVHRFASIR